MKRQMLLLPVLALLAPLGWADTALTPHTATYKVKIKVLSGELQTTLSATETGYEATHVIEATGLASLVVDGTISETSQFDRAPDGVRPLVYRSRDTITNDKTDATVRFDWEAGEARGIVNGEQLVMPIEGLAHDRVSIQYELMQDLLNGRAGDFYQMFEVDKLRPVDITFVGRKTVDVPAGRYEVIGVRHQAEGSKRSTTLWCAEELGYLPVIIEQYRKEKLNARAELSAYTPESGT